MRRSLLVAALLLGACGDGLVTPSAPPSPAATRDGRWVQDIDYLATELVRLHPDFFSRTPRTEVEQAAAELRAAVPSAPDHALVAGLMRLAALGGDAHTGLRPWSGFRRLPLRLSPLGGALYVTAAGTGLEAALGTRVLAFGESDAGAAAAGAAGLASYENEAWRDVQVAQLLAIPEVLHVLGASRDPAAARLTLEDAAGARLVVDVPGVLGQQPLTDLTAYSGSPLPLHRQHPEQNYWSTFVSGSRALYVQYNRCQEGGEPFSVFADRVLRALDQGAADRLIVDVRHNPGGNSSVDDPLVRGLEGRAEWRRRGRLFALIGGETFSSGMWTAHDLGRLGAVLVGTPTGGKPNSFGDVRFFTLPNSRIEVGYSTKRFRLVPDGDPPSVMPELRVEPGIDDVRRGRDPLLEAALAFPSAS